MTASILVAVLAAAGLAQTHPGFGLLASVGLAAPAEPYTELYFASPSVRGAGETTGRPGRQSVSFVIHNHEQAEVTYEWTIRSSVGTGALHGKVLVPRGGSARVTQMLGPVCGPPKQSAVAREVQVWVSLAHPSESIDYWTLCNA